MQCSYCGTPLPAGGPFCPHCGRPISLANSTNPTTPTPYNAPQQGAPNTSNEATPYIHFGPMQETSSLSPNVAPPSSPVQSYQPLPNQQPHMIFGSSSPQAYPQPEFPLQQQSYQTRPQAPQVPQQPPTAFGPGQSYPQAGPQQPGMFGTGQFYGNPGPPLQQQPGAFGQQQLIPVPPQTRSRRNSVLIITLVTVLVVCIIISSGIIYYVAVAQPATSRAQATAAANTYATAQTRARATVPANTPQGILTLATSGSPTINDSLSNPNTSLWANHSYPTAQCAFTGGAYRVTIKVTNYMYYCTPISSGFSNMALQVQMTIVAGNSGGFVFRASRGTVGTNGYLFVIFNDGVYALFRKTNGQFTTLAENRSPAIKPGLNQANLLTVVAKGNDIYLYINKQYVTKVTDNTYSEGFIGLCANANASSTTVAFNNAEAWDLP